MPNQIIKIYYYKLELDWNLFSALTDVLLRQQTPKILVGDPHQQIYSFRGAVNAMQKVEATHVFYLTQVGELSFSVWIVWWLHLHYQWSKLFSPLSKGPPWFS